MALYSDFTVHCDGDNCLAECPESGSSVREARRLAKHHGYRRVEGRDLCQPCYALYLASGSETFATKKLPR